jgi:hypothetical protein
MVCDTYIIYSGKIFTKLTEHDRLIVGRSGTEFPLGTPLLEWPSHGVATFKPFTGCKGLDKVRGLHLRFHIHINIYTAYHRIAIGYSTWHERTM